MTTGRINQVGIIIIISIMIIIIILLYIMYIYVLVLFSNNLSTFYDYYHNSFIYYVHICTCTVRLAISVLFASLMR